jgi:acyl-CoA thioesterase-1
MKLPPNFGADYTRAFQTMYSDLAKQYGLPLIPFFLEGVAAQAGLNQADGIHPTGQGYVVVVDRIFTVLEPLLKK